MCEFVHCLDNPLEVLNDFKDFPLIIIEYVSKKAEYNSSYEDQITKYGAKPVSILDLVSFEPGNDINAVHRRVLHVNENEPYRLYMLSKHIDSNG
jgi:hypothetical protein